MEVLDQVADRKNGISYFDFDGEKYARKDAGTVKETIRQQLMHLEETLEAADKKVLAHFLALAAMQGEPAVIQLKTTYVTCRQAMQLADDNTEACEQLIGLITPISEGDNFSEETARMLCRNLENGLASFNEYTGKVMEQLLLIPLCSGEALPEPTLALRDKKFTYLAGNAFAGEEFRQTWEGIIAFGQWSGQLKFQRAETTPGTAADACTGNHALSPA